MGGQVCMCCGKPVPDPTAAQRDTLIAISRLRLDLFFLYSTNHDGTVNMTARGEPGSILIYDDGSFDLAGLSRDQAEWPDWIPIEWTNGAP